MGLILESFGTVWTEMIGVFRNVHFESFAVMFVFGEGGPLLEGIPTGGTRVFRLRMDFHVTGQTFRRVETFPTDRTHFVLIFQVILANMALQLVLSRVTLPADITYILDTLVSGFLPQMNDIDVILKCCLGPTLVDAVFMRTEVVGRVRLWLPAPSLV